MLTFNGAVTPYSPQLLPPLMSMQYAEQIKQPQLPLYQQQQQQQPFDNFTGPNILGPFPDPFGHIRSELFQQQQRQQQQQQQQQAPYGYGSLYMDNHVYPDQDGGGGLPTKSYDIDQLASFLSTMASGMVKSNNTPMPAFRKFTSQILSSTRLGESTVLLSLVYLSKKSTKDKAPVEGANMYRMLVVALMLANKYHDDNAYTSKSWSDVSGIPLAELCEWETEWLATMSWMMSLNSQDVAAWTKWDECWRNWIDNGSALISGSRSPPRYARIGQMVQSPPPHDCYDYCFDKQQSSYYSYYDQSMYPAPKDYMPPMYNPQYHHFSQMGWDLKPPLQGMGPVMPGQVDRYKPSSLYSQCSCHYCCGTDDYGMPAAPPVYLGPAATAC